MLVAHAPCSSELSIHAVRAEYLHTSASKITAGSGRWEGRAAPAGSQASCRHRRSGTYWGEGGGEKQCGQARRILYEADTRPETWDQRTIGGIPGIFGTSPAGRRRRSGSGEAIKENLQKKRREGKRFASGPLVELGPSQ